MSEPALKCENSASFKQSYTLKLFIAFKMAYSCCLSLGGNLDFPEFRQKKFYNINNRKSFLFVNATRTNEISIRGCATFSKNGPFPASNFFIFVFSIQLTVNKRSINFADDWS